MKRSGEIELMRILAAIAVMNLHTSHYAGCIHLSPGGYVGVEFFFLLSGYLMAAHMQKNTLSAAAPMELCGETYQYIWRRLCSFWPELFIACCIGLGVFVWGHHMAVRESLRMALDTLMSNVLLLHMVSLAPRGVDAPTWYLSSLLLSSAILYPLFRRFGHSPVWVAMALMLLGYAAVGVGEESTTVGFAGVDEWVGWTKQGNLRAFAELMLGFSLFPLVQHIARLNVSRLLAVVLTFFKWGCYGAAFLYCLQPTGRCLPFTLCALACALVLCFSRLCVDRDWWQHEWVMWLGRFSLPLYLSHMFWAENLGEILPSLTHPWVKLISYHLAAGLTALAVMFLAKRMRHVFSKHA